MQSRLLDLTRKQLEICPGPSAHPNAGPVHLWRESPAFGGACQAVRGTEYGSNTGSRFGSMRIILSYSHIHISARFVSAYISSSVTIVLRDRPVSHARRTATIIAKAVGMGWIIF